MADNAPGERPDYDGLCEKLSRFAATLSPGEQFALADVLSGGAPSGDAAREGVERPWDGLMGIVSNNVACIVGNL